MNRADNIPTLETARLTLRAMTMADFDAYAAMMVTDRAAGMGGPFDSRQAWGMFCHDLAGWHLFGMGALMMDLRSTGETVGQVGINNGPLFPEPELGWLLYDGHEGQGYAVEGAAALRDWALGTARLRSLVSYTAPGNRRSIQVAERLGALCDPDARRPDPDDLVFRHSLVARAIRSDAPETVGGRP